MQVEGASAHAQLDLHLTRIDHDLTEELEGRDPDGELYDAQVKVLSEYVAHHVKEEQNEMFPKVRESSIDLHELGERLAARKQDLLAQHA